MKRVLATAIFLTLITGRPTDTKAENDPLRFEDVAGILRSHCVMCHSGGNPPLGLKLTSYTEAMAGSRNGAVIVAGRPGDSELLLRVKGISQPRMPLTGPPWLTDEEIAAIEQWIAAGAPAPRQGELKPDAPAVTEKAGPVTYTRVKPIFGSRCVKCHMADGKMGPPPERLRLDTYQNILRSGERAVIIPGNPEGSDLVRRIRGQAPKRMPLDGPPFLGDDEIRVIVAWIAEGARDPDGNRAPLPVGARVRLHGRLTGYWQLDGMDFLVDPGARVEKRPGIGDYVEVRGVVEGDGAIRATRVRTK